MTSLPVMPEPARSTSSANNSFAFALLIFKIVPSTETEKHGIVVISIRFLGKGRIVSDTPLHLPNAWYFILSYFCNKSVTLNVSFFLLHI